PLEARDTPSGSPLDSAFGSGGKVLELQGGAPATFSQIVVEPDGKILAAGDGTGAYSNHPIVARVHPDGSPDRSFGNNGLAALSLHSSVGHVDALTVQANGKILIAGSPATTTTLYRPTFELARLNADGSLDTSFGRDGRVTASFAGDIANYNAFATDVG